MTAQIAHIYLASRSPRRAELLRQLGIEFEVLASDIDETALNGEHAGEYVLRLARRKAGVALVGLDVGGMALLPVLAADTTVSVDGMILGKPNDDAHAAQMLKYMSGRWHEVHTGLAIVTAEGMETALSTTRVEMAVLSDQLIAAYIQCGEPRDKAGAYGIQGLAGSFIKRIEGSYTGVMGLPVFETAQLLKQAGISVL